MSKKEHINHLTERERINTALEKECLQHLEETFYLGEELKEEKDSLFLMKFQRSSFSSFAFLMFGLLHYKF